MPVIVLWKANDDIFYNRFEGDTTIDYYLIYDSDDDVYVTRTCAFAYSPSIDTYFDMNTERTENIDTVVEAKETDIALYPASTEDECRLSSLMQIDGDFFVAWMQYKDWMKE